MRDKYDEDDLIILACKKNASFFTYDGIEVGGERVAKEIEETIAELAKDGFKITRFSIVGYSLGGLFARYAIGLLDHKGYFEHITPVNFTTFASPHLGVRTPLLGYANHVWNVLGARTLSASGRQLFTIDDFRNTGRPLLSVLADPDSIFIQALSRFERRSLYSNIINDRTAVYYTTGISKIDPFTDLTKVKINYVQGYEPIILDPDHPYEMIHDEELPSFYETVKVKSQTYLRRTPIFLALALLLPIGIVAFVINSSVQTIRSRRRIMLHEKDEEGNEFGLYRIPLLRRVRAGLEDAFEATNSSQEQEYLPQGSEEFSEPPPATGTVAARHSEQQALAEKADNVLVTTTSRSSERAPQFPTLALTSGQFAMIKSLDSVGFRKYPVHIHKSSHSHAAIIVRTTRSALDEGKIVIKHWLEQEFKI